MTNLAVPLVEGAAKAMRRMIEASWKTMLWAVSHGRHDDEPDGGGSDVGLASEGGIEAKKGLSNGVKVGDAILCFQVNNLNRWYHPRG